MEVVEIVPVEAVETGAVGRVQREVVVARQEEKEEEGLPWAGVRQQREAAVGHRRNSAVGGRVAGKEELRTLEEAGPLLEAQAEAV